MPTSIVAIGLLGYQGGDGIAINDSDQLAIDGIGPGCNVRLETFDAAGRRVAALLDQRLEPGRHSIAWKGRADGGAAIGSGIYFARFEADGLSFTKRFVLVR